MINIIHSELVDKYDYAIISDAQKSIFCKQNAVPVTGYIRENFSAYYPAPRDYLDDFSLVFVEDKVGIYVGDEQIIELDAKELELIMKHVSTLKSKEDNDEKDI